MTENQLVLRASAEKAPEIKRLVDRCKPLLTALQANLKAGCIEAASSTAFDLSMVVNQLHRELNALEMLKYEKPTALTQARKATQ